MLYRCLSGLFLMALLVAGGLAAQQARAQGERTQLARYRAPPNLSTPICFDATQPNVYFTTEDNVGTIATNWATGNAPS